MAINENFNDFDTPRQRRRGIWWLYLVVGCFIVCLLVWIFSMLTKDDVEYDGGQQGLPATEVVQTPL